MSVTQGVIADDAAPANLAAPGLELRLDQGDGVTAGFQVGKWLGQGQRKGDKGHIDNQQVHRLGQLEGKARVQLLDADDAGIAAQGVGELAVAHVNGVDAGCAALQQAVGETAGRRANVEGDEARRVDGEVVEGVGQLDAAAADVGQASADFDFGVDCQGRAGLGDAARGE